VQLVRNGVTRTAGPGRRPPRHRHGIVGGRVSIRCKSVAAADRKAVRRGISSIVYSHRGQRMLHGPGNVLSDARIAPARRVMCATVSSTRRIERTDDLVCQRDHAPRAASDRSATSTAPSALRRPQRRTRNDPRGSPARLCLRRSENNIALHQRDMQRIGVTSLANHERAQRPRHFAAVTVYPAVGSTASRRFATVNGHRCGSRQSALAASTRREQIGLGDRDRCRCLAKTDSTIAASAETCVLAAG